MKIVGLFIIILSMLVDSFNIIPIWDSFDKAQSNISIDNHAFFKRSAIEKSDRFYEDVGGFSYIPPDGWVIKEIPGYKYKAIFGPVIDGFTPNINFLDEKYDGSIGDYVSYNLDAIQKMFKDSKVINTEAFRTDSGLIGGKIVISNYMFENNLLQTFYLLDGGKTKFSISFTRLLSNGSEFDAIAEKTARSFEISSGCTIPLLDTEFGKAFSRISFSLPEGWNPVTGTPHNNYRSYVKNGDTGGILLMVTAFNTNSTAYQCLLERSSYFESQFSKNNMSLGKVNVDTEEYIIDSNSSAVAIADGYSNVKERIPLRLVVLGIANKGTVFVFNFTASGDNISQAKNAIGDLDDDFDYIVRSIQIE